MPLAFRSESHGSVAFGFFNIESDMLLLEEYFFFSTVFCDAVLRLSGPEGSGPDPIALEGYRIERPEDRGDLMGAIHKIRYTGFIGAVYRKFPFPEDPEDFKQKPDGVRTQKTVVERIAGHAGPARIPVFPDPGGAAVAIGGYRFDRTVFHELIRYVWQGGYPRWKAEIRPDHVLAMADGLRQSRHALFRGLVLD